jgi:tetratricopeptide (TPR) repeat protein
VERVQTLRCYVLLTHRPEFQAPWAPSAYSTALTLQRLAPAQVEALATQVAGGKALPAAVVAQILARTEGVPLFVEEVTQMVLESGRLAEREAAYVLSGPLPALAIPTTVQASVQARLASLGAAAQQVAQAAAVWGRAVTEAQLQATVGLERGRLERAVGRLVAADIVHELSLPPRVTYVFKHALIQDVAYATLPDDRRRTLHAQIAQWLVARQPETVATQPELVAQHYTEAERTEQALPYWLQAGQQALQHSANPEAVQHLTRGLALLARLPETSARVQQELDLQMVLGPALIATKGPAAPEVEQTYARARALCVQVGETPQLFPTLRGLCEFYRNRSTLPTARALGEQLDRLAQRAAAPTPRLEAHEALGIILFMLGEYAMSRRHLEQGIALIDPTTQWALALRHGDAPGVRCLAVAANTLWCLGYPVRAVQRCQEALTLAQALAHPHSLATAQHYAAFLHHRRREASAVQEQANALLTLGTAQGFPLHVGFGTCWLGWALAMQGQGDVGLAQLHQGMATILATGQTVSQPLCLVLLAEAAGHAGQAEEGLRLLTEALAAFEASGRGDLLAGFPWDLRSYSQE